MRTLLFHSIFKNSVLIELIKFYFDISLTCQKLPIILTYTACIPLSFNSLQWQPIFHMKISTFLMSHWVVTKACICIYLLRNLVLLLSIPSSKQDSSFLAWTIQSFQMRNVSLDLPPLSNSLSILLPKRLFKMQVWPNYGPASSHWVTSRQWKTL
jgi:hypothetical protein